MTGGSIGGALEVRDKVVNNVLDRVNEMAFTLATGVNEAHKLGFDAYNKQGTEFFVVPSKLDTAAEDLKLNTDIVNDVMKIAAAAQPDSPGDNRVANVIAALQNQQLMDNGTSTIGDSYNGLVGQLAVLTHRVNMEQDHQKNIVDQLKNVRESVSGVSLDEEAVKMIEFQKAFDASARVIRTADEMFDTVLSLKR